jgi:hypothetical protein
VNVVTSEQKIMANIKRLQLELSKKIEKVAASYNVSFAVASDIVYLRGKPWWTLEKEGYIVKLARIGGRLPDMFMDFEIPQGEENG